MLELATEYVITLCQLDEWLAGDLPCAKFSPIFEHDVILSLILLNKSCSFMFRSLTSKRQLMFY